MKQILQRIIVCSVIALSSMLTGYAEIISPYHETFDDVDPTIVGFKPKGWGHQYYSSYYRGTYTATEETSGYSLKVMQSYPNAPAYDDFLVSPICSGEVTVNVKLATDEGTIKFYKVSESNGKFTKSTEIIPDINPALNTDEFQAVGFSNIEPGERIGIRGHNIYIDDFRATSADINYVRSLKINMGLNESSPAFTGSGSNITIALPEGNQFSLTFKVTLQNTGEVDFNPGDEGYTVTLTDGTTELASLPIQTAVACGETIEELFTFPLDGNSINGVVTFRLYEDISNSYDWQKVTIVPWHAEFKLRSSETSSSYYNVSTGSTLDFGSTSTGASRTYWIYNDGTAPLNLNISTTEGFTTDPAEVAIVAGGTHIPLVISMTTEPLGARTGNVTFTADDIDTFTLNLMGYALDPAKWYEDFESNKLPADMVTEGTGWSFTNGRAQIQVNTNDASRLITPKLHSEAGDKLTFKVSKNGSSAYYTPKFTLTKSSDRKVWSEVAELDVANLTSTMTLVEATIDEAGDWYYGLLCDYIAIEEIAGLEKVDVPFDIILTDSQLPASGEVNSSMQASISFRNVGAHIEAGSYTANLLIGGVNICKAEASAVSTGETKTLEFSYTPHHAGQDLPILVQITSEVGDVIVETAPSTITISEEVMRSEVEIGNMTSSTQNRCPVQVNGKYNWADMLYSADKIGLENGANINRIAFKAKSSGTATGNLKVWIENSEHITLPSSWSDPTEEPTKEFEWTFPAVQGEEGLVIDLSDTPFVYTGGDIRIRIKGSMTKTVSGYNWYTDSKAGSAKYDYESTDRPTTSLYVADLPVAFVSIVSNPTTISGTITDATTSEPVSGAEITVHQGNVEYYAVSAEDGGYTTELKKSSNDYILTVNAPGYFSYSEPVGELADNLTINVQLNQMKDLYLTNTEIPEFGIANSELTAKAVVRNVNTTPYAAESYSVRLIVDGECVAEAEGEALEANNSEFTIAGAEKGYNLTYTPYKATQSPVDAYVEIICDGEQMFKSPVTKITIEGEDEGGLAVIGTPDSFSNSTPLSTFNVFSETIATYPAELIDVPVGADITEITFRGYYTGYNNFETTIQAYFESTNQNEEAETQSEMTLVSEDTHSITYGGSSSSPVDMLVITLDTPWKYDGGDLKVKIKSYTPSGSTSYYETDSRFTCQYKADMSEENLANKSMSSASLPVMRALYENCTIAKGIVRDAETSEPIENAVATLQSGNVKYSATTEIDGRYEIPVVQRDKQYTLSVTAEGYTLHTSEHPDLSEEREILLEKANTGVNEIEAEVSEADSFDLNGYRVKGNTKGIVLQKGKKIYNNK
ncbi:MAG: carboxypeptidase regulatory-like domain-containing protein [Muribaculaceae bacterium]|nr:carboxypeptidase regulatory-like domain-containing protein [Muribaculaceae bacterium]